MRQLQGAVATLQPKQEIGVYWVPVAEFQPWKSYNYRVVFETHPFQGHTKEKQYGVVQPSYNPSLPENLLIQHAIPSITNWEYTNTAHVDFNSI